MMKKQIKIKMSVVSNNALHVIATACGAGSASVGSKGKGSSGKQKRGKNQRAYVPAEAHFQPEDIRAVRELLLPWYHCHRRRLPWRGDETPFTGVAEVLSSMASSSEASPSSSTSSSRAVRVSAYGTWVSEIMLQQTRVDTVIDYYTRWMSRFPTVHKLADASEEDVNSLWSGLGYYRRARLLHKGAKFVVTELGGVMPSTIAGLQKIPGIGPYTAGAIASIAFNANVPVVDGNVIRVLSRMRALAGSPKSTGLVQACWDVAERLNAPNEPGAFNQALMELGATICTPNSPLCDKCPVASQCRALAEAQGKALESERELLGSDGNARANERRHIVIDYSADEAEQAEARARASDATKYPFAKKKKKPRPETWAVGVVEHRGKFLLLKRPDSGLLAGQWEFPSVQIQQPGDQPAPSNEEARQASLDEFLSGVLTFADEKGECEAYPIRSESLGIKTHVFSHIKHTMLVSHERVSPEREVSAVDWDRDHMWATAEQLSGGSRDRDIAAFTDKIALTTGMRKVFKMVSEGTSSKKKVVPRPQKRRKTSAKTEVASKKISSFFKKKDTTSASNTEGLGNASVKGSGMFSGCMFYPVVPDLTDSNYQVRDFTHGLGSSQTASSTGKVKKYFIGRYNERRGSMYTSELFAGAGSSSDKWSASAENILKSDQALSERRDIHIGVDVGGPVGTPVHAFAEGKIHSLGYNAASLDYGYVIVTEHVLKGKTIWALQGHLSQSSVKDKNPGDKVVGGQCIGWFGAEHENGGWPPHVHFQLSLIEPATHDMPGVVSSAQHAQALHDYPDPRMVMGEHLYEGRGLFE